MEKLTRRQIQRIGHFFREKEERAGREAAKFHHRSPSGDPRRRESVVSLMAGKVDQMIIVTSFVAPPLRTGLIDRFLVTAGIERIDPLILLNKADLLRTRDEGDDVLALYRSLGYQAFMTSVVSGEGIDAVGELVGGRASLLAGHSGVGKSSLLNALRPGSSEKIVVSDVSSATGKGKHTTTSIRLYRLDSGTVVYDLPGIKLASLHDIGPLEIARNFPEFNAPSRFCRYSDCAHIEEPGCGVREAFEKGEIAACRYESYLRIIGNPAAGS